MEGCFAIIQAVRRPAFLHVLTHPLLTQDILKRPQSGLRRILNVFKTPNRRLARITKFDGSMEQIIDRGACAAPQCLKSLQQHCREGGQPLSLVANLSPIRGGPSILEAWL